MSGGGWVFGSGVAARSVSLVFSSSSSVYIRSRLCLHLLGFSVISYPLAMTSRPSLLVERGDGGDMTTHSHLAGSAYVPIGGMLHSCRADTSLHVWCASNLI